MSVEAQRQQAIEKIFSDLKASGLPAHLQTPLHEALKVLFEQRPNALTQLLTVAQAIRSPRRKVLWSRALRTVPGGATYNDLRAAVQAVEHAWKS